MDIYGFWATNLMMINPQIPKIIK